VITRNKTILLLGKVYPIQGGISCSTTLIIKDLTSLGNQVHVLTNSGEVEAGFRQIGDKGDFQEFRAFCGEQMQIHQLNRDGSIFHIPFSPAFSDRLFGKGLALIKEIDFDLIVSWYYQPYGVVAARLSEVSGIPFSICNAGSDLTRLSKNEDLKHTYEWMFSKANTIFSGKGSIPLLKKVYGISHEEKIIPLDQRRRLPNFFESNQIEPLEFKKYVALAMERYQHLPSHSLRSLAIKMIPDIEFDSKVTTIGMYGKCGEFKGSWDLLETLHKLHASGENFQFIYIAAGTEKQLKILYRKAAELRRQNVKLWILPPIPFIQIPRFIKLCDLVCILERDFPVKIHNVSTPIEVLAVGTCLAISKEIAFKSSLKKFLIHERNALIIDDPKNTDKMAEQLKSYLNRERLEKIGREGKTVYELISKNLSLVHKMAQEIEKKYVK
jgi:glycosyltransferase involved in cell wall biosynthesis